MKLFKVVNSTGHAMNGGSHCYLNPDGSLNTDWTPEQPVDICKTGWHTVDAFGLGDYIKHKSDRVLVVAETRGEPQTEDDGKHCHASIRLSHEIKFNRKKYDAAWAEAEKKYDAARAEAEKVYCAAETEAWKKYEAARAEAREKYYAAWAEAWKKYDAARAEARRGASEKIESLLGWGSQ